MPHYEDACLKVAENGFILSYMEVEDGEGFDNRKYESKKQVYTFKQEKEAIADLKKFAGQGE